MIADQAASSRSVAHMDRPVMPSAAAAAILARMLSNVSKDAHWLFFTT
jgi:hypothetical protein